MILSPIRATEENTKLKARLEQGKEETENLVCKLNNNVFTLKLLHILCNMFRLSLFSTCLFFHWFSAERENWSTSEQVCLNCSLFVGFLVREGRVTRNWRSLCVTCLHYNCKLFFSVWWYHFSFSCLWRITQLEDALRRNQYALEKAAEEQQVLISFCPFCVYIQCRTNFSSIWIPK